jgi:hypothetical protein
MEHIDIPIVIMPHTPSEEELRRILKDRYF